MDPLHLEKYSVLTFKMCSTEFTLFDMSNGHTPSIISAVDSFVLNTAHEDAFIVLYQALSTSLILRFLIQTAPA